MLKFDFRKGGYMFVTIALCIRVKKVFRLFRSVCLLHTTVVRTTCLMKNLTPRITSGRLTQQQKQMEPGKSQHLSHRQL